MSAAARVLALVVLLLGSAAHGNPRLLPAEADGGTGASTFDTITAGTNAGEALTVGAGTVLAPDMNTSGIIRANEAYFLQAYARPDDDAGYVADAAYNGITITTDTSGTGVDSGEINGLEINMDLDVDAGSIPGFHGIVIRTPTAEPSGTTIDLQAGIIIETLLGMGGGTDALRIDAQSCPVGCAQPSRRGNLRLDGGEWDNGHILIGTSSTGDHLFRDQTNEVFRIRTDTFPTSETDGEAIITSSGSANWGPMFWGVSDAAGAAIFDTGTEICALAGGGLTCIDSDVMGGDGSATTCATAHAGSANFWAFCQ